MLAVLCALTCAVSAHAQVGTTFPLDFPVPMDAALRAPVIGYGASGSLARVPVVLVHGNNDTPYPTTCNDYGYMTMVAQTLLARGWAPSEIWAVGWQGEQCDLLTTPGVRAGVSHTVAANVADIRDFVAAVRRYTGALRVDVVAHSLGSTVVREWLRADNAYGVVRRFVSVDGSNHGIVNCGPSPLNYYAALGFTPAGPLCSELGSVRTPLMVALNSGDETPGPTRYVTIVNTDASFVYIAAQDGPFPPVPMEDRDGMVHDFARSAWLDGARNIGLTGQAKYGGATAQAGAGTAHNGILASPETRAIIAEVLGAEEPTGALVPVPIAVGGPRPAPLRVTASAVRGAVRGRVVPPAGLSSGDACRGTVQVRAVRGGRTVSVRTGRVRASCAYRVSIPLRRAARLRARFLGNATLRPRSAQPVSAVTG